MIVEKNKKVFTKEDENIIMNDKYNPLNKDKGFYERKRLFMEEINEIKDVTLEELTKGITDKEKDIIEKYANIFKKVYQRGMIDCFNYYNKDGTF